MEVSKLGFPCLAKKPGPRLPWRGRSAGDWSTGPISLSVSPRLLYETPDRIIRSGVFLWGFGSCRSDQGAQRRIRHKRQAQAFLLNPSAGIDSTGITPISASPSLRNSARLTLVKQRVDDWAIFQRVVRALLSHGNHPIPYRTRK